MRLAPLLPVIAWRWNMVERIMRDGRRLERHLDDRTAERSPPASDGVGRAEEVLR
jgi:hypothetical protein